MTQCSTHDLFEKFLSQGLANVNDKLSAIAEALQEQNTTSARKLEQLMESQAERRELCGRRGAEIAALEHSDNAQWIELRENRGKMDELTKVVWKREGALVVVAAICSTVISLLMKYFVK